MRKILSAIDKKQAFDQVRAHCDVPCGIYDPITAQIAALTVVRMVDLIQDHTSKPVDDAAEYYNRLTRLVNAKEEHAEKAKHEVRVIWGDFIKDSHLEAHPQLNGIVHKIMALGSEARQHVSREAGVKLVEAINSFAQVFWDIKGVATKKAKAPYAPNLELLYPVL